MSETRYASMHQRYEKALKKLAKALLLEVSEVRRLCGDPASGGMVARKLIDFFGDPEIRAAWNDVIRISDEYCQAEKAKSR